jgi:adenylate kinase family enzyme
MEHCKEGERPMRREDDMNKDRIHKQFDIYNENRQQIKNIMTRNQNFDYFEIPAKDPINSIFDQICKYLDQNYVV